MVDVTLRSVMLAALVAVPLSQAAAQEVPRADMQPIVAHAADIAWRPGPPSLPPGTEFVLLEGDPSKAEPLTLRLRFPANYRVPPHFHSVVEHVTIFEGTLYVGMGDTADYTGGTALVAGSYGVIPPKMTHFAWTGSDGVTFQLHSVGPWSITYVDPKDDPRVAEK